MSLASPVGSLRSQPPLTARRMCPYSDGLSGMNKLRVLYLSNNKVRRALALAGACRSADARAQIKSFEELDKLRELPALEELLLIGNPCYENLAKEQWVREVRNDSFLSLARVRAPPHTHAHAQARVASPSLRLARGPLTRVCARQVVIRLPKLKKLDGELISESVRQAALAPAEEKAAAP